MTTYISRSLIEHARDFDVSLSKAPTEFYRFSSASSSVFEFTFQKPGIGSVLMQSRIPCTYFVYGGIVPYLDVMDGNENFPETEIFRVVCDHAAFCHDTDRFGLSLDELKKHASDQPVAVYDKIQGVYPVFHNIPLVGFMHSILSSLSKSADQSIVWLSEHGVRYYGRYHGLEVSYVQGDAEVYTPFPKVSVSPVCRDYGFYVYMEDNWLVACDKSETPMSIYTDRRGLLADKLDSPREEFFGTNLSFMYGFTIHVPKSGNESADGRFIPFPKSMKLLRGLVDGKMQLCYYDENDNVIETVMCDAPFADRLWFDISPKGSYHNSVIDYFRNGFDGMLYLYQDIHDGTRYMCVCLEAVYTQDLGNGFRSMSLDNNKPVCIRFFSRLD